MSCIQVIGDYISFFATSDIAAISLFLVVMDADSEQKLSVPFTPLAEIEMASGLVY
jgi:hypothetical protein